MLRIFSRKSRRTRPKLRPTLFLRKKFKHRFYSTVNSIAPSTVTKFKNQFYDFKNEYGTIFTGLIAVFKRFFSSFAFKRVCKNPKTCKKIVKRFYSKSKFNLNNEHLDLLARNEERIGSEEEKPLSRIERKKQINEFIRSKKVSPTDYFAAKDLFKSEISYTMMKNEKKENFSSPPKESIISLISGVCIELVREEYLGSRGLNSQLIAGARGIGKSTTLKNSIETIGFLYDNIIPIYIDFSQDISFKATPLEKVIEQLKKKDIQLSGKSYLYEIEEVLKKNNLYVFFIFDELDHLYMTTGKDKKKELNCLKILNEMVGLASTYTGRFYQIACGSSFYLPSLISKLDLSLKDIFPLIEFAPDLNGSKFSSYSLGSPFLNDEQYKNILKTTFHQKDISDETLKLFKFICGYTIRKIDRLSRQIKKGDINTNSWIDDIYRNEKKESKKLENFIPLIEELNRKLLSNNSHIKSLDFSNLNWTNFETGNIVPIAARDIEKIVKSSNGDLVRLLDTGVFVRDIGGSLYPESLLKLYCFEMKEKGLLPAFTSWLTNNVFKIENFNHLLNITSTALDVASKLNN